MKTKLQGYSGYGATFSIGAKGPLGIASVESVGSIANHTNLILREEYEVPFKINNLQFDNYRAALDYFESKSIFVDVITHTTVNEILGFEFWLKSWQFIPIKVGDFLSREEGYLAALKIIESLDVN